MKRTLVVTIICVLTASCIVWQPKQSPVVSNPPRQTVPVLAPPVVSEPAALRFRSGNAVFDVRADFGSFRDKDGLLIYTPNTAGAIVSGRYDDWAKVQREAGLTHMVIGDFHPGAYPNSPFENPDWRDRDHICEYVWKILNTPSAEVGVGFTPIMMFDGGDYPDSAPKDRVNHDWPVILDAVQNCHGQDLRDDVIVVPGYELIKASQWSSSDVSYALEWLGPRFPNICVHNSPGRTALSSNPPQADDPWHSDEADSLKTHGGEFVDCVMFQIDVPRLDGVDCDYVKDDGCVFNRFNDIVTRLGGDYKHWGVSKKIIFAEATVFGAFRNWPGYDAEFAKRVADRAEYICNHPIGWVKDEDRIEYEGAPVSCGFMNGIPHSLHQ